MQLYNSNKFLVTKLKLVTFGLVFKVVQNFTSLTVYLIAKFYGK